MPPNARLRELLIEAGCSNGQLARWVTAIGEERGLHLTYSATSVARWLGGTEPHWPTGQLVVDAFNRNLGSELVVSDLGWRDRGIPASRASDGSSLPPAPASGLRTVASLAGRDLERRTFLRGTAFVAGAFAGPALLATTVPPGRGLPSAGSRRLSAADVEAIRDTTDHFRGADQRFGGGGRNRIRVVRLLQGEVKSMLGGSFSTSVGQKMYAAVAEMTRLVGYMTFDAGRHALAQRYYIQALGLAHASDDATEVAITLSTMSFQAVHLGDGREAVALARAALRSGRKVPPGVVSMLHAIEARGLALLGEERECAAALSSAEEELQRSQPADEPAWLRYYTDAELSAHASSCMRDLDRPEPAYRLAGEALEGYPANAVRSRGFAHTVQAVALLGQRQVEAACAAAFDALDIAGRVDSARSVDWLRDFNIRLRPFSGSTAAREFSERSKVLLGRAG